MSTSKPLFRWRGEDDGDCDVRTPRPEDLRTELKESEERIKAETERHRELFMQAPAAIAILRGPHHVFTLANQLYQQLVGKSDLIGKPGREALPELSSQGIWDIFDTVFATGERFIGNEFPVRLDRLQNGELDQGYFNFVAQPTFDVDGAVDGVLIHAFEVTEQVTAREHARELARQLNRERMRLQFGQSAAKIGTFEWIVQTGELIWTAELEAMYGYGPSEFSGDYAAWASTVHPDDLAAVEQHLTEAIDLHRDIDIEFRIIARDASMRWIWAKCAVHYLEDGTPDRAFGINMDVTERKQIETNLHFLSDASSILSSSLDYQTTLRAVATLAVPHIGDWCSVDVLDSNGEIQQVAVAHKDPEKVEWARRLRETSPPDMSAPQGLPQVLRTGHSEIYALITDDLLVATARNEEELALMSSIGLTSVIIMPIMSQGRPIGGITFVTTESRRRYNESDLAMAEELAGRASLAVDNARLYMEAQDAIRLRDDFMSIASHELKTPVTSLKVYTQLLQKQAARKGDDNTARSLAKMEGQVDKLTKLIGDLLDVSKVQVGRLEYEQQDFRLDELVHDLVEQARASTPRHEIVLEIGDPIELSGDRNRIGQVIINLLNNAIKYSPEAERIIVRVMTAGEMAIVSVQDFGIGIDEEHLGRIFERFYQVRDPQERTFPGLGIGLYISQEIAHRHGGQITVQSGKGEGSTFRLVLPMTPVTAEGKT